MKREEKTALHPQRELPGGWIPTLAGDPGWNLGVRQMERTEGEQEVLRRRPCAHTSTHMHTHTLVPAFPNEVPTGTRV